MVYKKFRFTDERAARIQALVQQARPGTNNINTVNRNYYAISRNASSIHQRIAGEIMVPAVNNMPPALRDAVRRETTGIRVMVRKRYEGEGYARTQRMHVDVVRKPQANPAAGEAYLQIIYYVNSPKIKKDNRIVNAPADLSGRLLLAPMYGIKPVTILTPKRGVGVYFSPNDTFHEVLPRKYKSDPNIKVSRDMVIMFLFKKTERSPINAAIPASNNVRKLAYGRVGLPSPNKMGGISPSKRKSMYSKISTILRMRGSVANKASAAHELLRTARRTVPALERLKKRTAMKPIRSPKRSPMNVNRQRVPMNINMTHLTSRGPSTRSS
jgi:hypothetical protein